MKNKYIYIYISLLKFIKDWLIICKALIIASEWTNQCFFMYAILSDHIFYFYNTRLWQPLQSEENFLQTAWWKAWKARVLRWVTNSSYYIYQWVVKVLWFYLPEISPFLLYRWSLGIPLGERKYALESFRYFVFSCWWPV
jgi:hypothetical protein